jgi:hypothetical protein
MEARNLGDVDFTVGASLKISGLTAWQGLFEHGRLQAGQSVLMHGAGRRSREDREQLARKNRQSMVAAVRGGLPCRRARPRRRSPSCCTWSRR